MRKAQGHRARAKSEFRRFYPSFCIGVVLLVSTTVVQAAPLQEDQAIDRELGLLGQRWQVNLTNLRTRDYLRSKARVRSILPPHKAPADPPSGGLIVLPDP